MGGEVARVVDIAPQRGGPEGPTLEDRVTSVEARLKTVEENTEQILAVLKTGKGVYKFVRPWFSHVVTALMTAGFLSSKWGHFIISLLGSG